MLLAKKQIDVLLNRYEKSFSGRPNLSSKGTEGIIFRFREEIADVVSHRMYDLPEQQAEELVVFADQAVHQFENVLKRRG